MWPAAEADGICLRLLQSYGADNCHPERAPWQSLQARRAGKDVQGLLLCPMVVHLKDQPHTTDLLKALLEQEENDALTCTQYPPSTSSRTSQPLKPVERYHRQLPAEKRNNRYTVHPAQLDADQTEAAPEVNSVPLNDKMDMLEIWYHDGFLIGLRQAAEVSEQ